MQNTHFREILQKEYEDRCDRNPRYSLRAYARDLGLHAACLSVILKGKRPITPQMMKRMSQKISMSDQDLKKLNSTTATPDFEVISYDIFALISIWYHDAILELVQLNNFKPSIPWIAKVLEITPTEAQFAVDRLVRCEMLRISKKNHWTVTKNMTTLHATDYTTAAMKHLQKKILKMSESAIDRYDISERYHSSLTLAFNKKDINKAKAILRKFKEEFSITMQKNKNLNEVYQLNIGFFPMTNITAVSNSRGETK